MLQESSRIESDMQEAVSTVQNLPASANAAGQKRAADTLTAPDAYSQLHTDKRVKLEV